MNIVSALLGRSERRALSLADMDAFMDRQMSGPLSATGLAIYPDTALTSAVVYACVNVLAQTIAALPLPVYRRLPNGGKERAPEHRLYPILHDLPNPEMTSFELRMALVGHQALWGNAYAEIERSDAGINALWPLRPDRMTPGRDETGALVYNYRLPNGQPKVFQFVQIMHWRALSGNGIVGYSPIAQAAESVGLDLATRQYGARFFGNDSRPGGFLTHPKTLSDAAATRIAARWEQGHRGLSNAQRVAVLEEGITWTQVGIPPEEAQFLETRRYGRSEIAGLYRVPLHMINDLERATFSNVEHLSLEFAKFTLTPWLVQIEQAIQRDLFAISDGKRTCFAEHLMDGLLRGDIQSRYAAYNTAHMGGWMNADEIRERENMNQLPGGAGAHYWMPLNMQTVDQALEEPEPPGPVPAALAEYVKPAPENDSADAEDSAPDGAETGGDHAVGD